MYEWHGVSFWARVVLRSGCEFEQCGAHHHVAYNNMVGDAITAAMTICAINAAPMVMRGRQALVIHVLCSYVSWTGEMKIGLGVTKIIIWQNYNQSDTFLLRRRAMAAAAMVASLACGCLLYTSPSPRD